MRRRLILQAIAVTSMVALAFLVPLASLVSDFAADRALTGAERVAQNVARYMAFRAPLQLDDADLTEVSASVGYEISIVGPDGRVTGKEFPAGEDLTAALAGTAGRANVEGGGVVYLPVIGSDGSTSVVRVFVPEPVLGDGVARSWLILAGLGLSLVAIAVLIADCDREIDREASHRAVEIGSRAGGGRHGGPRDARRAGRDPDDGSRVQSTGGSDRSFADL